MQLDVHANLAVRARRGFSSLAVQRIELDEAVVVKLLFEIWCEDGDGASSISLCRAGPDGDSARSLHGPNACLVHTFEAETYYEAMATRNRLMGWGEYKPDPSWGSEPYEPFTVEQRRIQESGRRRKRT